jgi:cGMP-dependent protein kinase
MNHPLILLLVKTFETPRSMYILTELVTGGDLFNALDCIERLLRPSEAQFYVGSLVLVLEHISDRHLIYRDLKPENVLLDAQGYVKLIDFGTAKKLSGPGARTYTVIGSWHFMAPEVSKRVGYGTEADIWSLGVIFFECVNGYLPFGHNVDDPTGMKIMKEVTDKNLEFSKHYTDQVGKHLLRGMMRKDPAQRLGAGVDGYTQIRDHEYFRLPEGGGNLFDKILGRQLDPPFCAATESYMFDEEEEEEDALSDADELCRT